MKRRGVAVVLCLILCLGFSGTVFAAPDSTWKSLPTQARGRDTNTSRCTKAVQRLMMNYSYETRNYIYDAGLSGNGIDGSFGRDTELAVRLFQETVGLTPDGSVGPATWQALRNSAIDFSHSGNGFHYYCSFIIVDGSTLITIRQGTTTGNWGSRPWGVTDLTDKTSWNVFNY